MTSIVEQIYKKKVSTFCPDNFLQFSTMNDLRKLKSQDTRKFNLSWKHLGYFEKLLLVQ